MHVKKFNYYISRMRQLPPGEAMKKVLTKPVTFVCRKLENIKARLFSTHISDKQLIESLYGIMSIQEVLGHIKIERPKFFVEPSLREELAALIQREFTQLKDQIVTEADKVCSHIFDLLGSGDVNLDRFAEQHGGRQVCGYLPWHYDFKTGYRWNPKKFYKEIEILYGKADIKIPWELSRFQHAAVLGQAYWLTGDEKYAQEFVHQVDDWIDLNPPKFGVNWACTMDVAIRVANWILGFYFFKHSQAFTDHFLVKFLKSLLTHGRHIMANLENKGITTNHYLADLIGLIYLGICFPEFKGSRRWREFGVQELVKEMEKEVYSDGMDFEASTCYHRLALELFFYPTLLCQLNEIDLPRAFFDKLEKMFDFVLYVLKPNGRMPQIGDNDNGRLHVLGKRDILDMTYLLTYATVYRDDPSYKIEEFGFAQEALWLFGPEGYKRWSEMSGRSVEELQSRAFPDGGIYVMRHKKDYMVISCGPNGQGGLGGHAHNDKLSFELCVDGEDFIVDPGTYLYTADPEWRNKFRSTAYHNTVLLDGDEQSRVHHDKLFELRDEAHARCEQWESSVESDLFVGRHSGYRTISKGVVHRREIQFDKKSRRWNVKDILSSLSGAKLGDNYHSCCSHLHFSPLVHIEQDKKGIIIQRKGTRGCALGVESGSVAFIQDDSWYSPSYGTKLSSKRLICCEEGFAPCNIESILEVIKESTKEVLETHGHDKPGFEKRI